MATRIRLQCPQCAEKFRTDTDFFATCPKCGHTAERPDVTVISAPFIKTPTAISTISDRVYRDMEKASEHRMHVAAEMAGVPASEMSEMKITNMRDNVQIGESAAMPVNNAVTQQMDALNARGGQFGFGASGREYAMAAHTGVMPRRGNQILHEINPSAGANILGVKQS